MSFDEKPKYEIKPTQGRAWKNQKPRDEKSAHFTGTYVDENGTEHFLDVWLWAKDEDVQTRLVDAVKYMSFRTKKKDKQTRKSTDSFVGSEGVQPSFPDTQRYDPGPKRDAFADERGSAKPPERDWRKATEDDIPF